MIAKKNKPDAGPGLLGNESAERGDALRDLQYKLILKAQAFIYSETAWFVGRRAPPHEQITRDPPGAATSSGDLFLGLEIC